MEFRRKWGKLNIYSSGNSHWNISSFNNLKWYPLTTLSLPSQEINFMIWKANSAQGYGRLSLLTPFLSSIYSSPRKKKLFLAAMLRILSLTHLTPKGKVVTLLMSSGDSVMARTLTPVVALSSECDCRATANYLAISSSKLFRSSKKPSDWWFLKSPLLEDAVLLF